MKKMLSLFSIFILINCSEKTNPIVNDNILTLTGYVFEVTDTDTIFIKDAIISISNKMDTTDLNGYFEITNLEKGELNIGIKHNDYNQIDTTVTLLDNSYLQFSLIPILKKYNLSGYIFEILDNDTVFIADALVNLDSTIDSTNSKGYFNFNSIIEGEYNLNIRHDNYDSKDSTLFIDSDQILFFNLRPILVDYLPLAVGNYWIYEYSYYNYDDEQPLLSETNKVGTCSVNVDEILNFDEGTEFKLSLEFNLVQYHKTYDLDTHITSYDTIDIQETKYQFFFENNSKEVLSWSPYNYSGFNIPQFRFQRYHPISSTDTLSIGDYTNGQKFKRNVGMIFSEFSNYSHTADNGNTWILKNYNVN